MEVITLADDRAREWSRAFYHAFSEVGTKDETLDALTYYVDPDRRWGVLDERDRITGTCGVFATDLAVPGGRVLPCAAVTAVGVLPTHRRRRIATALMTHHLRDSRDRGEPVSLLEASEATIYRRFGYGAATLRMRGSVTRGGSTFASQRDAVGDFELLAAVEASEVLPALYDHARRDRPGEIGRTAGLWAALFTDPEEEYGDEGPRQDVVHRGADGEPDGFVTYRVKSKWGDAMSQAVLTVEEIQAADPKVAAALWRYVFDIDLMATVQSWYLTPDDPLRWLLADPRQLRCTALADGEWIRILDLEAALTGRGYLADGTLVLDIHDPLFDDLGGTWRLHIEDGVGAVERTATPAQLRVGIDTVGALYLGGMSARTLADAGRIEVLDPAAVVSADRLFAGERYPRNSTAF
ncbi:MAG: GNAT family N-acetyltransferase [Actinobacteria bacterium]|nr:GNAT family N-acetyltransferase [Actinomycetota bacterium]